VTTGQLLKRTLTSAWPRPLLAETCTTTDAEVEAPWLSVTVRVRVWSPSVAGAVQTVWPPRQARSHPALGWPTTRR
jgi:hypothetical protein